MSSLTERHYPHFEFFARFLPRYLCVCRDQLQNVLSIYLLVSRLDLELCKVASSLLSAFLIFRIEGSSLIYIRAQIFLHALSSAKVLPVAIDELFEAASASKRSDSLASRCS